MEDGRARSRAVSRIAVRERLDLGVISGKTVIRPLRAGIRLRTRLGLTLRPRPMTTETGAMPDIGTVLYSDLETRPMPERHAVTPSEVSRERIEPAPGLLADVTLDGAHAA